MDSNLATDDVTISDAQKKELERRLELYYQNPHQVSSYGSYSKFSNIKEQLKQGAIKRVERDLGLVEEWFNFDDLQHSQIFQRF